MTIGPVIDCAFRDGVSALTIAVVVEYWAHRLVDWKFLPVDTKATELSVEVGEIAALQEWIIGEPDAWDYMRSAECYLLYLTSQRVSMKTLSW